MKEEFNNAITATAENPPDPISIRILDEGREELRSNHVPLVTVPTTDDADREIAAHNDHKIFIICSGTVGGHLVETFASKYPYIHNYYIYTGNILLHLDWADRFSTMIKMFNFPTNLLLRLIRDIAYHFIEQGRVFLSLDAPNEALTLFNQAKNLEMVANVREARQPNSNGRQSNSNGQQPNAPLPDFRDHLDLLEGAQGLIAQATDAIYRQGGSMETS